MYNEFVERVVYLLIPTSNHNYAVIHHYLLMLYIF